MKMDKKFYGLICKAKDDTVVPPDQYVVFLVKDNAFAMTLPEYRRNCEKLGCEPEHLQVVDALIERVNKWRRDNPDMLKNPDTKGERLLD